MSCQPAPKSCLGNSGWLRDLLWPSVEPWTARERESEDTKREERLREVQDKLSALSTNDSDATATAAGGARRLVDAEQERRASVESRLGIVLGMTSIATSVVFGTMLGLSGGGIENLPSLAAIPVIAVMVYAAIQLLAAVRSAIRGLERRSYEHLRPAEVMPSAQESSQEYQLRMAKAYTRTALQHQCVTNDKVSQMAVAHVALRNFVGAVFTLVVGLGAVLLLTPSGDTVTNRVLRELRSDSELIEVLRGPRGLRGAMGPQGPSGQKGDKGPAGKSGQPGPRGRRGEPGKR